MSNPNITIVTGLWDLGRGSIDSWAKRDFSYYKEKFFEFLECDAQMCIWVPKDLEEEVRNIRKDKPTSIHIKNVEDFKTWFPFFDKLQEIRKNPDWFNQAGWLQGSPQAALEYYNPMMMCKMFMVNDSSILNPFDSQYFFWVDGGLTSTVNKGYFTHDKVLDKLDSYCISQNNKIIHISYPYIGNTEIHGFDRNAMAKLCNTDYVNYVARGGFFGGLKQKINEYNSLYYNVLQNTINSGLMGADECLFTILCHQFPEFTHRFEIEGNGLVWPFFENLKNYNITISETDGTCYEGVNLYVLSFNSPAQFEKLIESYLKQPKFLRVTKNYLIDNSTKPELNEQYVALCKKHNFEQIKKDNIGICGGRQFIAEHFESTNAKYCIFLEDDMNMWDGGYALCKNGFIRQVDNLYDKIIKIMETEKYDFLKFSFTEFFGDNTTQWAWYNVPQGIREKFWPNKSRLPTQGLDPNAPKTVFNNIGNIDGLSYIDGEIYYCNWPQIVSRQGNKKLFLKTKWAHPFEQTWMSHAYQLTKVNSLKGAVLLASPINHHRFEFYKSTERREN